MSGIYPVGPPDDIWGKLTKNVLRLDYLPLIIIMPDGREVNFAALIERIEALEAAIAPTPSTSRVEYNVEPSPE